MKRSPFALATAIVEFSHQQETIFWQSLRGSEKFIDGASLSCSESQYRRLPATASHLLTLVFYPEAGIPARCPEKAAHGGARRAPCLDSCCCFPAAPEMGLPDSIPEPRDTANTEP